MKKSLLLLGAGVLALVLVGCDGGGIVPTSKLLKVTISYAEERDSMPRYLSWGAWVLVGSEESNPLFTKNSPDKAEGLEVLAETGDVGGVYSHLQERGMVFGLFAEAKADTDGKTGMTSFRLVATPGSKLYFATMVSHTNDWFAAPDKGIELISTGGAVNSSTTTVDIWDAGTETDVENPYPVEKDYGPDPDENVRIVAREKAMFEVTVKVEKL